MIENRFKQQYLNINLGRVRGRAPFFSMPEYG